MAKKINRPKLAILNTTLSALDLQYGYPFALKNFMTALCDTIDDNNFYSCIDILGCIVASTTDTNASDRGEEKWSVVSDFMEKADDTLMSRIKQLLGDRFGAILYLSQDVYKYGGTKKVIEYQPGYGGHQSYQLGGSDPDWDISLPDLLKQYIDPHIVDDWIVSGNNGELLERIANNPELKNTLREYL